MRPTKSVLVNDILSKCAPGNITEIVEGGNVEHSYGVSYVVGGRDLICALDGSILSVNQST